MIKYVKIKDDCERLHDKMFSLYKYKEKYGIPNMIKVLKETSDSYLLELPVYQEPWYLGKNRNYYNIDKEFCEEVHPFSKELEKILNDEDI